MLFPFCCFVFFFLFVNVTKHFFVRLLLESFLQSLKMRTCHESDGKRKSHHKSISLCLERMANCVLAACQIMLTLLFLNSCTLFVAEPINTIFVHLQVLNEIGWRQLCVANAVFGCPFYNFWIPCQKFDKIVQNNIFSSLFIKQLESINKHLTLYVRR